MENTKDNIIYQALTLFSDRGYEGVSMRDIAESVGIKASSIYNHFKSKEDIFSSIMDEMSKRYEEAVLKMQVPHGDMSSMVEIYMHVEEKTLVVMAKNIFLFILQDDFASKFRRMLIAEQFRSPQAGDMFLKFFIEEPVGFQNILFESMIKQGVFIDCDPYIMALHFYSPIFLLLNKYDHKSGKIEEALDILEKHVKQFSAIYSPLGRENLPITSDC